MKMAASHAKIVKRLLADPNWELTDTWAYDAMKYACIHGHFEVARLLLSEPRIVWNWVSIHLAITYAAENKHQEIIDLLVQHRYKIDGDKYLEMSKLKLK